MVSGPTSASVKRCRQPRQLVTEDMFLHWWSWLIRRGARGYCWLHLWTCRDITSRKVLCFWSPSPSISISISENTSLRLEALNRKDIENYVTHELGSERHMRKLLQLNPRDGNWFITDIVQRASGVFFWVIFVNKSLIHGFRNGDRIHDILKKLEALPADLETLFGHILELIEPGCQQESSKIFQVFRWRNYVLDLFTLYCALLYDHPPWRFSNFSNIVLTQMNAFEVTQFGNKHYTKSVPTKMWHIKYQC